jgi:phage major head subunit gpT-like protein
MLINEQNVELAFRGFKATFDEGALQAETYADKIAMTIPRSTREEHYGWLGTMPNMREWIGLRHVNSLQADGFALPNIYYERTVAGRAQPRPPAGSRNLRCATRASGGVRNGPRAPAR